MARRERAVIAVVAVIAAAAALGAPRSHAQKRPLRVAIYAPWSGPQTADARHSLALAIEGGVEDQAGAVEVASYAKFADFRAALTGGRVDVAVVDAAVAIELGNRVDVRASWSSGEPWLLAGARDVEQPRGAALALQATDAPSSRWAADRLLRGQTRGRYWGRIVGAPVTADARELVDRGKADLVLVRRSQGQGLAPVIEVGTFSELALVTAGAAPGLDQASAATQRIVRARLGGDWSGGAPSFPAELAPRELAAAKPVAELPPLTGWLRPLPPRPAYDLHDLWMEPDAP